MSIALPIWSGPLALQQDLVPALLAFAMAILAHSRSTLVSAVEGAGPVLQAVAMRNTAASHAAEARPDQPGAMPDRRRTLREPMGCGARLELAGRAWAVNLLDLSEGGAGVQAPSDIATAGAEGHLVIDTAVVPVRVVSVGPDRVGLAFGTLPARASATIRSILSDPPRPPDA